jgi:hypothetical protein
MIRGDANANISRMTNAEIVLQLRGVKLSERGYCQTVLADVLNLVREAMHGAV